MITQSLDSDAELPGGDEDKGPARACRARHAPGRCRHDRRRHRLRPRWSKCPRIQRVELDEATAFGRSGWQRPDEFDRADDRARRLPAARGRSSLFSRSWNSGGSRYTDLLLDRVDEAAAAEANVMFEACPRRYVRCPRSVSSSASSAVALELAFEEHAVEIEDDRREIRHRLRTAPCRPEPRSRRASPPG